LSSPSRGEVDDQSEHCDEEEREEIDEGEEVECDEEQVLRYRYDDGLPKH